MDAFLQTSHVQKDARFDVAHRAVGLESTANFVDILELGIEKTEEEPRSSPLLPLVFKMRAGLPESIDNVDPVIQDPRAAVEHVIVELLTEIGCRRPCVRSGPLGEPPGNGGKLRAVFADEFRAAGRGEAGMEVSHERYQRADEGTVEGPR